MKGTYQLTTDHQPLTMLRISTFSSFQYKDFRFLWASMAFSSSGQWMEQVALSWLVWELTGDPLMLGFINGARAIPFLLSPLGGVAADRIDRKLLMLGTQVVVMLLSGFMALLLYLDLIELWMVFAFTMLSGLTWAFNQPVRQAIVPNLVPRHEITNAIALTASAFNMTRLVGPVAAGFIIGAVGAEGAFAGKAIAYVGVIGMIVFMRVPPIQRRARRESVFRSMMGGFEYVRGNPTVLALLVLALIPMLVSMPYMMAFMPVFADEVYGIGPEGMGMLYTFAGIGSLAGTFTVASLGQLRPQGVAAALQRRCDGHYADTLRLVAPVVADAADTGGGRVPADVHHVHDADSVADERSRRVPGPRNEHLHAGPRARALGGGVRRRARPPLHRARRRDDRRRADCRSKPARARLPAAHPQLARRRRGGLRRNRSGRTAARGRWRVVFLLDGREGWVLGMSAVVPAPSPPS